jgi:hypothetical protein
MIEITQLGQELDRIGTLLNTARGELAGDEWTALLDTVESIATAAKRAHYAANLIAYETEPWCNHDAVAVVNGVCECGEVIT